MTNQPLINEEGQKTYRITGLDALVLLVHIIQGAKHPEVGFEDTNHTRGQLRHALDCEIVVTEDVLESALWSCNLMDETKAFWHPDGLSFEEFVKGLSSQDFDRFYNYFKNGGN